VFCGGRGATSILQALLRTSGIQITALVNAYDDGLSTGRVRGFVPGMLGASDFRKNLSRLLVMSSPVQFAVADLLEYRFPPGVAAHALDALVEAFAARAADRVTQPRGALPPSLVELIQAIDARTSRERVSRATRRVREPCARVRRAVLVRGLRARQPVARGGVRRQ
jgi:2-phospho-L-lactate transferase/gluconeogenesis factor (CofD/UPF0052 family)